MNILPSPIFQWQPWRFVKGKTELGKTCDAFLDFVSSVACVTNCSCIMGTKVESGTVLSPNISCSIRKQRRNITNHCSCWLDYSQMPSWFKNRVEGPENGVEGSEWGCGGLEDEWHKIETVSLTLRLSLQWLQRQVAHVLAQLLHILRRKVHLKWCKNSLNLRRV